MKNMLNNSFSIFKRKFHDIFHPVFYDSNSVGFTIQGLNDFMNRYCTSVQGLEVTSHPVFVVAHSIKLREEIDTEKFYLSSWCQTII